MGLFFIFMQLTSSFLTLSWSFQNSFMLWFIGYLKKVMEPKKKGPQRAVINGSLWPIVVFWLSREGYGTKKKVPQRAVIHCSLWHLIVVFRLSWEGYGTKKKGATESSYKLLSVAPCGFFGYLEKVMEPKKKGPQRAVINCSLWHLIVFFLAISIML